MSGKRYVLLDLLGAQQPWSPNTIRSRLALRFKGVDFGTKYGARLCVSRLSSPDGSPTSKSSHC